MKTTSNEITIDGRALRLSNLDKVLYRTVPFTKGQVIDYYLRVADVMLPHLSGRPVTLKRYPEGSEGMFFYEKNCPSYRPPWVKIASAPREKSEGSINYCLIEDRPTLAWVANLAALELHTLLSTKKSLNRPTMMVFDLDPGPPATVLDAIRIALRLRDWLAEMKLECWPKTSGGKGIHLCVPLNTSVTFEDTKAFSHAMAQALEQDDPGRVVSKMSKTLRAGKVFVDWSQNDDHKTTVCVYSLRARERPTVSTPVEWEELETALNKKKPELVTFEAHQVVARVEKLGDLMKSVLNTKQKLPDFASPVEVETKELKEPRASVRAAVRRR